MFKNGGPGGNNLEPEYLEQILLELEVWSDIIDGDPYLVQALKAVGDRLGDEIVDHDNFHGNADPLSWEPAP